MAATARPTPARPKDKDVITIPRGTWLGIYGTVGEEDHIAFVINGVKVAKMFVRFDKTLDIYDMSMEPIGYFQGVNAQDEAKEYLEMLFTRIS